MEKCSKGSTSDHYSATKALFEYFPNLRFSSSSQSAIKYSTSQPSKLVKVKLASKKLTKYRYHPQVSHHGSGHTVRRSTLKDFFCQNSPRWGTSGITSPQSLFPFIFFLSLYLLPKKLFRHSKNN